MKKEKRILKEITSRGEAEISITKALELLLGEKYCSEFRIVDGVMSHPEGLTFAQWLVKHNLVVTKNL